MNILATYDVQELRRGDSCYEVEGFPVRERPEGEIHYDHGSVVQRGTSGVFHFYFIFIDLLEEQFYLIGGEKLAMASAVKTEDRGIILKPSVKMLWVMSSYWQVPAHAEESGCRLSQGFTSPLTDGYIISCSLMAVPCKDSTEHFTNETLCLVLANYTNE